MPKREYSVAKEDLETDVEFLPRLRQRGTLLSGSLALAYSGNNGSLFHPRQHAVEILREARSGVLSPSDGGSQSTFPSGWRRPRCTPHCIKLRSDQASILLP